MKLKRSTLVLLTLLLLIAAWLLDHPAPPSPPAVPPVTDTPEPKEEPESPPEPVTEPPADTEKTTPETEEKKTPETEEKTNLVFEAARPYAKGAAEGLSDYFPEETSYRQWVMEQGIPKVMTNRMGSYTNASDVFTSSGGQGLDLSSDWLTSYLLPNRALPTLRMRVTRDPDTGEYQITGGSLGLPGTGWEAGYEIDPEGEERKSTLQWKKSF